MEDKNKIPVMIVPDVTWWILGLWAKRIAILNKHIYDFIVFPLNQAVRNKALFLAYLNKVEVVHFLSPEIQSKISAIAPVLLLEQKMVVSQISHINDKEKIKHCLAAKKIVVVCKKYFDELLAMGVPKEKLYLVYNGVDTKYFSPMNKAKAKKMFGFSDNDFIIGFSAKSSSDSGNRKGFDIFLEVLTLLKNSKISFKAFLTGPGWQKFIDNSELRPFVKYTSFLESNQMPSYYNALDVFLVTSRVEGGPATILEAMSCEVPVVTTPVGLVPEVIEDGINGLLIPINNSQAAMGAILKLYRDVVFRQQLGLKSRKIMIDKFDFRHTLKDFSSIYRRDAARWNSKDNQNYSVSDFARLSLELEQRDILLLRATLARRAIDRYRLSFSRKLLNVKKILSESFYLLKRC